MLVLLCCAGGGCVRGAGQSGSHFQDHLFIFPPS